MVLNGPFKNKFRITVKTLIQIEEQHLHYTSSIIGHGQKGSSISES